ncbi:dTDP-4-dehydrorhamnose reductase [Candidatus Omnitrophota bacterium]
MKILITGSSGMLGTELCGVFAEENEIVGVDVTAPLEAAVSPQVFYEANITDLGCIKEVFDKEKPELVIHAAAWTDVDGCERDPDKAYAVNVLGTENVVRASARTRKAPVIFISTDFVFDGGKGAAYTEVDQTRQINVYGRTKRAAEEGLERARTDYAIVRTGWLYGKNGKNFVDTVIAKGRAEGRLRVVDDQVGSPTYTKDLARALKELVASLNKFKKGVFHVSNSGRCSWYDFALKIFSDLEGMDKVVVEAITSRELARPAQRPRFSVLDNSRFQNLTGHKMRPWQEALAGYISEHYSKERE